MKREFLEGDRVMIYEYGDRGKGTVHSIGNQYVQVKRDHKELPEPFYPEQLRRLRPRKKEEKKERVECWAVESNGNMCEMRYAKSNALEVAKPGDLIHRLVELREGERVISQHDLFKAMRIKHGIPRPTCHAILDLLGFPKEKA